MKRKQVKKRVKKQWTLAKMIQANKDCAGSGLQREKHPNRHYSPRIHEGPGGLYFVFKEDGRVGYRMREFFKNGHTSYSNTRVYRTSELAHKAAYLLSKLRLPAQIKDEPSSQRRSK